MLVTAITHFVFVDFENVPGIDLGLVEGKTVHVTLLIGKNQAKIPFELVDKIHRLAEQVELVKLGAAGRNALDLTLAHYLGRAVVRRPDADFLILSKDKDFDPLVEHLKTNSVRVARRESFADLPFSVPRKKGSTKPPFAAAKSAPVVKLTPPAKAKAPVDKYPKLLEQIKSGKQRPGTRAKLMHHIHTLYGQKSTPEQLTAVVDRLIGGKLIAIDDNNKVSYT